MSGEGLKKWEIARVCAVAVSLLWGCALGRTPCCAWWGAIYPELTPEAGSVETAAGAGGVVLRFQLLEWLEAALRSLRF